MNKTQQPFPRSVVFNPPPPKKRKSKKSKKSKIDEYNTPTLDGASMNDEVLGLQATSPSWEWALS